MCSESALSNDDRFSDNDQFMNESHRQQQQQQQYSTRIGHYHLTNPITTIFDAISNVKKNQNYYSLY